MPGPTPQETSPAARGERLEVTVWSSRVKHFLSQRDVGQDGIGTRSTGTVTAGGSVDIYTSKSWELGSLLCKTQASIFFLNVFVSAFLLAAISVDRWLLAAKPVWSQNHRSVAGAWKVCVLGWLWAAINTILPVPLSD
ncbi:prostaglandin D2 receptor 2-like [Anarhichas minor]|uniref:prostaglandin D2 receptor 2-like n=1 Tax=Anarhichas minor TaxID=65739 RepID=UPI003F7372A4